MLDVAELFKSGENELTELHGDGDFRSPECLELLDEADIVVTNPPFSLFREYVGMLVAHQKKFIIIGNVNAVKYRETFPLIMNNELWLGASIHSGDRAFYVPDDYPLDAASCGIDEVTGRKYIRVKGVRWFTNPNSYYVASYGKDNLTDTGTITITNEKKLGALTIKKSVTVNDGDVPNNAKTIADGTYTFSITGPDNYSESRTIIVENGTAKSSIVLTELKEGTYTISETGSSNTNGISLAQNQTITVVAGSQASTNVVSFTNNLATASIEIIKVEKGHKDSNHTLNGAKFQLTRVDENGNNVSGDGAYQSEIQTVDSSTGKTTFSGLYPTGRYKLEEKEAPAGYVLVETPWYITVDSSGAASLQVAYTMASAAESNNSFFIENEPGAALPNTGGPGTNLIYLIGSILLAFAGGGMLMRRKRRVG